MSSYLQNASDNAWAPPDALDFYHTVTNDHPPQQYVIEGMEVGSIGSLIAPGGIGKSWIGLQIAIGVAGATDTVGVVRCDPGRVLYLALEDSVPTLKHRVRAIGQHLYPDMADAEWNALARSVEIYPFTGSVFNWGLPPARAWLQEAAWGARLIIVDTLLRSHALDENAASEMAQLLSAMEGICASTGAAMLFLHHTHKNSGTDQTAGRGSSVLVDNLRGGARHLQVMSRELAAANKISDALRDNFVCLTNTKTNVGEKTGPRWFERGTGGVLIATTLREIIATYGEERPQKTEKVAGYRGTRDEF